MPPKQGAETAAEVYLAMGVAISWWEGSEDILMGLFKQLCFEREPTAFETYVASPRNRRGEMLKAAAKRYAARFQGSEVDQLLSAMKALDKLAATRNEIAHGHCSSMTSNVNGELVMSGHYLLPSLNEQGWHARSPRYAHTPKTMEIFTQAVRYQRGVIMDISLAMMLREQEIHQRQSPEVQVIVQLARRVVDGSIEAQAVTGHLALVRPLHHPEN